MLVKRRLAELCAVSIGLICAPQAFGACAVPHTLTNGQAADATEVMDNFDAIAGCVDAAPAGSTNAIQTKGGSGTFSSVGPLTNGQVVVGVTGSAPQAATITAGAGVTVTNGAGAITITATGGGTGASISALRDALRIYAVEHRVALDTTVFVNGVINWGGLVGFVFEGMASSNDSGLYKGTTFTVPTGKHAVIVNYTSSHQNAVNPTFYALFFYNDTTNYWVTTSNQKSVADTYELSDNGYWTGGAFTAMDSEKTVAAAGDVVALRISNPSNDGIKRANGGSFIIAIVDDVTGLVDPVVP